MLHIHVKLFYNIFCFWSYCLQMTFLVLLGTIFPAHQIFLKHQFVFLLILWNPLFLILIIDQNRTVLFTYLEWGFNFKQVTLTTHFDQYSYFNCLDEFEPCFIKYRLLRLIIESSDGVRIMKNCIFENLDGMSRLMDYWGRLICCSGSLDPTRECTHRVVQVLGRLMKGICVDAGLP